jgi:hypothetical protein
MSGTRQGSRVKKNVERHSARVRTKQIQYGARTRIIAASVEQVALHKAQGLKKNARAQIKQQKM